MYVIELALYGRRTFSKTARGDPTSAGWAFLSCDQKAAGRITNRDLRIAGLFLYLGEGQKGNRWVVGISNSDPEVIRLVMA